MHRIAILIALLMAMPAWGVNITRYVSIGATGDGLTPETPTSDISALLRLAPQVDRLEIFVTPGIYQVPDASFDNSGWPNVRIVGVDDLTTKGDPAQLPTIETNFLHLNGATLGNLEIYGGLELQGGAYLVNVKVNGRISHTVDAPTQYRSVECKGILLNGRGTGAWVDLFDVTSVGSRQFGLEAHKVEVSADHCAFNTNRQGGARIEEGRNSSFAYCTFSENQGQGACVIQEFRDYMTHFLNCEFSSNSTDRPHYYGGGVSSLASTLVFSNCIFSNNHSDTDAVGGAIKTGARFAVTNCWFDKNDAAIRCDASPGEAGISDVSVTNSVFTGNGKELYSPSGYNITNSHCAMQRGSGIPEIDAQNGTIAIHPQLNGSIEGVKYAGIYKTEGGLWALSENSALINAGKEVGYVIDFYGANRCIYGKTDIGPFEYVAPIIPDAGSNIEVNGETYHAATSTFKGVQYGFLTFDDTTSLVAGGPDLYCGRKADGYKLPADGYAAVYIEEYGKKYCVLCKQRGIRWTYMKYFPYSGNIKPLVKKLPGEPLRFQIKTGTKTEMYTP